MTTILLQIDGPIARIKLNRPDVKNAFNDELIGELEQALEQLLKDKSVRVLVLSGEGDFFCAGADLNWMKSFVGAPKKKNEADARRLAKLLKSLNEFPKPTIAKVHGAAIGGGVGLLAACDIAVAVEKTVFSLAEVKLGLIPAVISPYVIARMGLTSARRYFLTGERFGTDVALRVGLIQEAAAADRLDATVEDLAKQLLSSGPDALKHCKELIRVVAADVALKGNFGEPGRSILEYTVEKIASLRAGPEAQEGMKAFLEKENLPGMFSKILIANRGEIAVRIARACRELRIPSVAVYSDPDTGSLHARVADEAHALGGSTPAESYLNVAKLIDIAKKCGADAVHPGFGFLSENAKFAEACAAAGIKFIGPTPEAILKMGDKIGAKLFLKPHGIPVIPGVERPVSDPKEAKEIAEGIGYPILVKAAAGGGGKGMRVVRKAEELAASLEGAQREAKNAFNDDRVFIEKYIEGPRHVEIQVVADEHGKVIHLFERECSLQRRHQKVIEETPSVALDPELRERMGATAVKIAELIGYTNIGTMEFILDAQKNFYFLEVNTRLQVEHPITEMVTGVDLVKTQIRVAMGEKLDLPRRQHGHAIECRIYAEDPEKNFLPSIGKVIRLREPRGEGIRVDTGIYEGWTIPMEYDPMLAKLVVHAPTRAQATMKMLKALAEYEIVGVKTNIPFLMDLLRHPTFVDGRTETSVIERYFKDWLPGEAEPEDPFSPWNAANHWRVGEGERADGDAQRRAVMAERKKEFLSHRAHGAPEQAEATAPMPGTVRKVLVAEGQKVAAGEPVVVIEAMKMEHTIDAPKDGIIKKILYKVGDKVGMGEKLVEIG